MMRQQGHAVRFILVVFAVSIHIRRIVAWSPSVTSSLMDLAFVPPGCNGIISEELCLDTARRMQRINVPVSTTTHPDGQVGISFVHWPGVKTNAAKQPKVVLIHGFDSSALEFRRLGSRLSERGIDTYAVDLWGWGFTRFQTSETDGQSTTGKIDFSAAAKVAALQSWITTVLKDNDEPCGFVIVGASLGGAAAMETAVRNVDSQCQGLILMDAQGFVDGVGLMSLLPPVIARWGVNILQSVPLRSSANQMSYANPQVFATDEAVVVGRLHCLRPGWNEAMVNFMKSGGFQPSTLVPQIAVPTLVVWGRQDTILDGATLAPKFVETIQSAPTTLKWIEDCGHVPHLEQPDETADAIANFVQTLNVASL